MKRQRSKAIWLAIAATANRPPVRMAVEGRPQRPGEPQSPARTGTRFSVRASSAKKDHRKVRLRFGR